MTVCRNNQILAVGSPVRARRTPFISAIREVAVGDLPRRSALCTHNKHLHEPGLEITHAVEPVHQLIVRLRRIRPLGSCGWCRKVSEDRKSTRLNSSHGYISYAVF